MFVRRGRRRIKDRAKVGRIERKDRGLMIVSFV